MARYTQTDIGSGYNAASNINAELDLIETAIGDTLSRKGDGPNTMEADLDLNDNKLINVKEGTAATDGVNLGQISGIQAITASEEFVQAKTVAAMVLLTGLTADTSVVQTAEFSTGNGGGGTYDVVLTSSVTPNTYNIIIGVADATISFVLRIEDIVYASQFGAAPANTDNQAAIQAALDYLGTASVQFSSGGLVQLGRGKYKTLSPLVFKSSWVSLEGVGDNATSIEFTGSSGEAAVTHHTVDAVYSYNNIRNMSIRIVTAGTYGIRFDKSQSSNYSGLIVQMLDDNQIAFYGKGNGGGSGPYYNNIDNVFVAGTWSPGNGVVGQIGFRFELNDPSTLDAPSANMISNIKQVKGVNTSFDIQAGNGNMFVNIGSESVEDYVFDFGNVAAVYTGTATSGSAIALIDSAAPFVTTLSNGTLRITSGTGSGFEGLISSNTSTTITLSQGQSFLFDNTSVYEVFSGKCADNKVVNLRHENTTTTALVRNGYGAHGQSFSNVFSTGADTRWINLARDPDTVISPNGGNVTAFTFYAENIASNTTTTLTPVGGVGLSIDGGIRVPWQGNIISAATAVSNMGGSAAGTATVKVIQNGSEAPAVTHDITANNRFGYTAVGDVIDNAIMRDKNLHVTITTDASWDATASDMAVTVFVAH